MKFNRIAFIFSLLLLVTLTGCRKEKYESLSHGILQNYVGIRLQPLRIACELSGGEYAWRVVGYSDAQGHKKMDTLVGQKQEYIAIFEEVGTYHMRLDYSNGADKLHLPFDVLIEEETTNYSPYISDVLDYNPAPGQGVNVYPRLYNGISQEEILARCRRAICGNNNDFITLGGFGGSVTFMFDHIVINVPGERDFKILSNTGENRSEPGIVMVAYDANGNGKPDEEEWYELRGSADSAKRMHYSVTYTYRGEVEPPLVDSIDDARGYADPTYIKWTDSEGNEGFIPRMKFGGKNPYWPQHHGKGETTLTFTGSRLPNNGTERVEKSEIIKEGVTHYTYQVSSTQNALGWGYADDVESSLDEGLDIGNAIDKDGNSVWLPGIHFVRVYTAVNQQIGQRGESSTEIYGAVDLHVQKRLKQK